MSKIVGYKYIGTVNGLQQFEPIIEEGDLTKKIVAGWYEEVERSLKDKLNQPWSYNESWPVDTSRWLETLKPVKFKEDGI